MFKCMFFRQYKLLMRTDDHTKWLDFHAVKIYANAVVANAVVAYAVVANSVVANGAVDRKLKHDSFWRFMGCRIVAGRQAVTCNESYSIQFVYSYLGLSHFACVILKCTECQLH